MGIRIVGQKHAFTKCVAIDVDGTLIVNGKVNGDVVAYAQSCKDLGFEVILWSAKGKEHAAKAAKDAGIEDVFSCIISKPGYVVDDLGWTWTKFTRVVRLASLRREAEQWA